MSHQKGWVPPPAQAKLVDIVQNLPYGQQTMHEMSKMSEIPQADIVERNSPS